MVPRNRVQNQFEQGASPVVYLQQQSSGTSNASSLLQWGSHRMYNTSGSTSTDCLCTRCRNYVKSTKLRCKKGLSALEAMVAKGIKQCHLFLLYQSVIVCVTDYGLGLTTLLQLILLKLDRVQNEAMRVTLGTTKDTPIEAMCYLLDLPPMELRHKVEKVKVCLSAMQDPENPLHDAVKEAKGVDVQEASRGWAKQNSQSSMSMVSQSSSK